MNATGSTPPPAFSVSNIEIKFVHQGKGRLVAWASCIVNDSIELRNIAIRRSNYEGFILTYPRKDLAGELIPLFRPISNHASMTLERAVLRAFLSCAESDFDDPSFFNIPV